MPRRKPAPPPPSSDSDPVLWFARLVRAVAEKDWPVAVLMRDTLASVGWDVRQRPRKPRVTTDGKGGAA